MTQKTVSILGSTGSVGRNATEILEARPDLFSVKLLSAQNNYRLLAAQARRLKAEYAAIGNVDHYHVLKELLSDTKTEVIAGIPCGDIAGIPCGDIADVTVVAIVGAAAIAPTMQAVQGGKTVALANKESIVCAGGMIMAAAARAGTTLLPVDSEHNAIFQVSSGQDRQGLSRVILTASGGPFLRKTREELAFVTREEALKHPHWNMGAKISIDSATMANKSLEIIEAKYLFNLKSEDVDVVIHPQSIVHSMVEYKDGSILCHMGSPDMKVPLAYCLGWPERIEASTQKLNLAQNIHFSFERPDTKRFSFLTVVRDVMREGQGAEIAFNAANEVAVEAFLSGALQFSEIESVVERALQRLERMPISSLEDVYEYDRLVRAKTLNSLRLKDKAVA